MSQPSDDDRTVAAQAPRGGAEPALSANALPTGTRLHEFEIVELIGEGGFGIVYLARDCVLERNVALKEYLPSSLASRGAGATVAPTSSRSVETFQMGWRGFINEPRIPARFVHPRLGRVIGSGRPTGTATLVG